MCLAKERIYRFHHNDQSVEIVASSHLYAKGLFSEQYGYWPQDAFQSLPKRPELNHLPNRHTVPEDPDYTWQPYV